MMNHCDVTYMKYVELQSNKCVRVHRTSFIRRRDVKGRPKNIYMGLNEIAMDESCVVRLDLCRRTSVE